MTDAAPGQLALARHAGFPTRLLVPLAPPSAPFPGSQAGKVPAVFLSDKNEWSLRRNWREGVSTLEMDEADLNSANVGLILGTPHKGFNFLAVDVDTEPHETDTASEQTKAAWSIVGEVGKAIRAFFDMREGPPIKTPFWVRFGRPGRGAYLIGVPEGIDAGTKTRGFMTGPNGENMGKIELLATGQQIVLGGAHPYGGGTPIEWRLLNNPKDRFSYPAIKYGFPLFKDRAEVDACMSYIFDHLQASLGVVLTAPLVSRTGVAASDTPISLTGQAALSASNFIELMNALPHDSHTFYDMYINTLMAASGCISAMQKLGRANDDEVEEMVDAVISWASRWEGGATDETTEREKWDRDIVNRPVLHLGWTTLVRRAAECGFTKPSIWAAQNSFEAECEAPEELSFISNYTPSAREIVLDTESKGVPARRRGKRLQFDVKSSDIQLADFVQDRIGDGIVWIPEEKDWAVWSGAEHGGWSNPNANGIVRTRIEDQLVFYVSQFSESFGNNEGIKSKLTSESRVTAVEKLLRSRLSKSTKQMSQEPMTLQTPTGMLRLTDGKVYTWEEQRASYEKRCAAFAPSPGETPLFDSIVNHLACHNDEVAQWLWSYAGYALLGNPTEQVLLIVTGPGENGKSKFANVLRRIMGDYAAQIDRRVLAASGKNDHPTGLNSIKGRRLWCVSEFQENEEWAESQIKALSGGDPINARAMHQDMTELTAEGTFLVYTNFVPSLQRVSAAIVRRFRILNARLPVPADQKDPHIEDKIISQEAEAILHKLVVEAQKLTARGFKLPPVPEVMRSETQRYFASLDTFSVWFSSQCEVVLEDKADPIPVDDIYKRYTSHIKKFVATSGNKGDVDLDEMDADVASMSTAAFIAAIRRSGGLVDTESIPFKTGTGAIEYERRRVVKGVRLRIQGVK